MTAEPEAIRTALSKLIEKRLKKGVDAVSVVPSLNEEGDEYLLVTVKLTTAELEDETLENLLEEIESQVATLDERYPSVRFLDAA